MQIYRKIAGLLDFNPNRLEKVRAQIWEPGKRHPAVKQGPDKEENVICQRCYSKTDDHGLLFNRRGKSFICPGDYIVIEENGIKKYSPKEFKKKYELVD
jgi:hypothetical protein